MGFEKPTLGESVSERTTNGIRQSSAYLGGTPRRLTVWVAVARLCTVKAALQRGWRYPIAMWRIDVEKWWNRLLLLPICDEGIGCTSVELFEARWSGGEGFCWCWGRK